MKLETLFKQNSNKPFIFFNPTGGNWGDVLIRTGAEKLANNYNIKYENKGRFDQNFKDRIYPKYPEDSVIYIHGCGGIGKKYQGVPKITKIISKENKNNLMIFGPTTAMIEPEDLKILKEELKDVGNNFIFFARERTTYKFMKENFDFKVYLDVCPSLHLEKENFIIPPESIGEKYKILVFRKDKYEKVDLPKEINIFDYDIVCDPADQTDSMKEWLGIHCRAHTIVTNRLHSAILGMLLGKNVTLFANNYHKNRSVWEYCLKQRGVKWKGKKVLT